MYFGETLGIICVVIVFCLSLSIFIFAIKAQDRSCKKVLGFLGAVLLIANVIDLLGPWPIGRFATEWLITFSLGASILGSLAALLYFARRSPF
ncbi:hypothetical protein A2482_00855 [Candidatus Falkowbacteria bacterium RIFOXYC2_FULL_48_21]|uniref:Uncharacterized protein n=1 Tax=Candidatus Falkowbacteria bacterium RIFOXYC2_FULL_48_21 TaxID=1798005 RepID=A0A1F5T6W0_9BACT|nr:MAG: hypothetical protein A2482_00855 [Candidatus Falkowbacteria bacterium RIFOXYC2_FULL_48_21]